MSHILTTLFWLIVLRIVWTQGSAFVGGFVPEYKKAYREELMQRGLKPWSEPPRRLRR